MSEENKATRRQRKAALTRVINNVGRFIAEENVNEVLARCNKLMDCFKDFECSHENYHSALTDDDVIEESDQYFFEVQRNYISTLESAKQWLKNKNDPNAESDIKPSVSKLISIANLPKVELEKFDGDPLKYHEFIALFKECVENVVDDSKVRLTRLLQYTSGKAKDAIRSCALMEGNDGYTHAMELLHKRFGNDHLVTERILRGIRQGKPVNSPEELSKLSDDMSNCLMILKQLKRLHEVDSQSFVLEIVNRLQPYLKNRWRRSAMEIKRDTDKYPGLEDLVKFISEEAEMVTDPVYSQLKIHSGGASRFKSTSFASSAATAGLSATNSVCVLCKEYHRLFHCKVFKDMKPNERFKLVADNKLCKNCLRSNHSTVNCRSPSVCSVPGCGRKHTRFLHLGDVNRSYRNDSRTSGSPSGHQEYAPINVNNEHREPYVEGSVNHAVSASTRVSEEVFMPIVPVIVNGQHETYALLDTASSNSFCTRALAQSLGLQGRDTMLSLYTLSNSAENKVVSMVDLFILSIDGKENLTLHNVFVVDDIPVRTKSMDHLRMYSHLRELPTVIADRPVELLLGQDNSEALIPLYIKKGKRGEPFASKTLFGWTANGRDIRTGSIGQRVLCHFISTSSLEDKVNNLWNIEMENFVDHKSCYSQDDRSVLKLWNEQSRLVDGHYELPIPWKPGAIVPNNFVMAKSRAKTLRISLSKRGLMPLYGAEMNKMLTKGHAELVPIEHVNNGSRIWYLPHHAVLNPKKPGKLRIVFDCAAKYQGESLNDKCFQGPDLTNKLLHVLLRFRMHHYAVMADIEAMYYQVLIPQSDRDSLRFLWFDDVGGLMHCRMTRHVFGGVWCSSSSAYALQKVLLDCDACEPIIADTVSKAFYVDDCLSSCSTSEDARTVIHGTKSLLSKAGFKLTKFVVNDGELLNEIPVEERASEVKDLGHCIDSKALGVTWSVLKDSFGFEVHPKVDDVVTKRSILSVVSSLFDPLGLVSPVLLSGKLIFQDVTRLQLHWDEPVPDSVKCRWKSWIEGLSKLNSIYIPRCVKPTEYNFGAMELHHFSDASLRAYGCCSYLRCINEKGQIHVAQVCSKSRVAPIKATTIPRLELQAAVLAAEIDSMLVRELDLDLMESHFWVDSELVLVYIKNETKRFHVFVGNRVSKIRQLTKPSQWHHVAGVQNPADLLTREQSVESFASSKWFHGPHFLLAPKSEWMEHGCNIKLLESDPEVIKEAQCRIQVACVSVVDDDPLEKLINHYSSWDSLKRAVSWLLRLKNILRGKFSASNKEPLSVVEMRNAEAAIVKQVQSKYYERELNQLQNGGTVNKSSKLRDLDPIIDSNGIIRVGGRLRRSHLESAEKHPYILPHNHHVSKVIIRDVHEVAHQGTEWTLSLLRSKFWITRARVIIKKLIRDCITCKKIRSIPCQQKMSDLPEDRTCAGKPPFNTVGLDCFGPFLVKVGRSQVKRYGCIFTCFSTRAIHLEKLNSLDTDSFLNGLRRFISRRGRPERIYSDNGTNFIGAKAELQRSMKQMDDEIIQRFCARSDIEWIFNPPGASHMGGVWERLIRTVRKVLCGIFFGQNHYTDEVLETIFCEVEMIVNGRPITKSSDDVNDLDPLTPNHLLLLRECLAMPPGKFLDADIYKRRWRQVQFLADTFWKRWLKEYIPDLQRRSKWTEIARNCKRGDLVLILDESTPRGLWPMGIIEEINPSKDGLIRSVKVRTKSSTFVRPITKLVFLESSES